MQGRPASVTAKARLVARKSLPRRGVATVWIIGLVPVGIATLMLVLDYGNLWLAREELENAVEAGALAGAKQWGDLADNVANRTSAHIVAKAIAEANTVVGQAITVDANDDAGAGPLNNNNLSCTGQVLLGDVTGTTFSPNTVPGAANNRGCRVDASHQVPSFWSGMGLGPYTVNATATARYDTNVPRLVRITTVNACP